jgi:hypothetical protein
MITLEQARVIADLEWCRDHCRLALMELRYGLQSSARKSISEGMTAAPEWLVEKVMRESEASSCSS